ncbi:hypothetical protein HGP28_17950 [Vibrio sp. SM6]|uniref:Uncharacterized protein n=1 Tax=Vibrio agarilyticus TaxID=2726741 RepID=A0A7X8TTY5_9VIBR|nr:hypothetical protein [Vibrio agarilyticus]NLS14745.1 hypothetical protein [Vibrio agarilyticus]
MSEILNELQEVKKASQEQTAASQAQTAEVSAKMGEIDKKVDDGIKEVTDASLAALQSLPFFTVNANNNFMKYITTSGGNPSPYKGGWGNGLDGKFETEIIPVTSGVDPESRHEIAKELMDFMGLGSNTRNFSGSFNILRIKNVSGLSSFPTFAFHIPWQHIKANNWTYMVYCRGVGFTSGPNETYNGSNQNDWRLYRRVYSQNEQAVGNYVNVDMWCGQSDAEIWLALPSIIPGIYPQGRKLPNLFNVTSMALDEHWNNYDALHNETDGVWNPVAQVIPSS